MPDHQSSNDGVDQVGSIVEDDLEDPVRINGHESRSSKDIPVQAEELENNKDEISRNGATFYKLEMVKIQLFSSHGNQTVVEVEDFVKAQPDAIAHSAAKIVSCLNAGGEKTTQALKSLCWRLKGLQVELIVRTRLEPYTSLLAAFRALVVLVCRGVEFDVRRVVQLQKGAIL